MVCRLAVGRFHYLQQPGFEILHAREALFLPPLRQQLVLRSQALWIAFLVHFPLLGRGACYPCAEDHPCAGGQDVSREKPFWRVLFSEPAS